MNNRILKKSIGILTTVFVIGIIIYFRNSKMESYYSPAVIATHYSGKNYVGSSTCIECHADIYENHIKTAHFNTSTIGSSANMKGNFTEAENVLKLQDVKYKMVSHDYSFYEESFYKNKSKKNSVTKIDIIIGSGIKGQSYLTWENNQLYQIQPSYYVPGDKWINSPNFPQSYTRRAISDACLKCHTSFAKNKDARGIGNYYDREKIILGIDCERCHQPAAEHVIYHRNNPEEKDAKFLPKFSELSRNQRLDACAVCHSGLRSINLKENPFSFLTGDNLDEFSKNPNTAGYNSKLDVHGNQYGLLKSSACFKQTNKMDCTTCHDSHKNQRGNLTLYNQKCMQCHTNNITSCSLNHDSQNTKNNNCVNCHMPNIESEIMKLQLNKDSLETPVHIRTHLIGIYPQSN